MGSMSVEARQRLDAAAKAAGMKPLVGRSDPSYGVCKTETGHEFWYRRAREGQRRT